MKTPSIFSRIIARGCAVALPWLGFSCSDPDPELDPSKIVCMYGTLTSSFEVKGSVTAEDGTVIPNAVIRVTQSDAPSGVWSFAKGSTDKKGAFDLSGSAGAKESLKIVCISPDDSLESDSITVPVKLQYDKDHPDDKKVFWYLGHANVKVDFKLKPKSAGK